jgi:hypothetical protein
MSEEQNHTGFAGLLVKLYEDRARGRRWVDAYRDGRIDLPLVGDDRRTVDLSDLGELHAVSIMRVCAVLMDESDEFCQAFAGSLEKDRGITEPAALRIAK